VDWLLQWHPHFWPTKKRVDFLAAVGNSQAVATGSADAQAILPASKLRLLLGTRSNVEAGWSRVLDEVVWQQYTSSKHRQFYDSQSVLHLLRFMRNAHQHNTPGTPAHATFAAAGGVGQYFLSEFPKLLMVVWEAVWSAGWGTQCEFQSYLPSAGDGRNGESIFVASQAATERVASSFLAWTEQEVAVWLAGIGGAFAQYGDSFNHNGINGEELAELGSDELEQLGVSLPLHRKRILKEIRKLQDAGSS
jgi:hypothetical protein